VWSKFVVWQWKRPPHPIPVETESAIDWAGVVSAQPVDALRIRRLIRIAVDRARLADVAGAGWRVGVECRGEISGDPVGVVGRGAVKAISRG
jgi:hypothetical protein